MCTYKRIKEANNRVQLLGQGLEVSLCVAKEVKQKVSIKTENLANCVLLLRKETTITKTNLGLLHGSGSTRLGGWGESRGRSGEGKESGDLHC